MAIEPDSTIGAVEHAPHFADERERRHRARMPARAGRDENQAVDARFQRLLRMTQRNHVVQHDAAVAMHRVDDLTRRCAQARDENGHLVFDAHAHVVLEPRIRLMNDLVDGDRAR